MNIVIFIVISALVVLMFGYMIISAKKRKSAVWAGTVIDKNISETVHSAMGNNSGRGGGLISFNLGTGNNNQSVTKSYYIIVKTDDGQQINWPISSGFYEQVNIGDGLSKPSGTVVPEITARSASPEIQQQIPTVESNDQTFPPQTTPPFTPNS